MLKDIGFWNEQGKYIPDIQEIGAEEMDKEFFNDIDNIVKVNKLEQENADLKKYIERMDMPELQVIDADIALENAELKADNERLKEEIKEVKKYQYEQEFLEKEIEEQREKNKRLTCKILEVKALNETLNVQCTSQDCTQLRKLHQTLQKIKSIADEDCEFCDDIGGCMDNECRKVRILDLITKAEEE